MTEGSNEILTAKEYSEKKGKDSSWATRIAKQANAAGYTIPKKMGNYWVATYEEWENTLQKLGIQLRNRESYKKQD